MTTLWMIEDLEPFPDTPAVGELCEPTTYWSTPDAMELPADVVRDVEATVDEVTIDGRTERVARFESGFTTMIPDYIDVIGEATLAGCLVWDRYLWTNYHTKPVGQVLVTERVSMLRRTARTPSKHPGWYTVEHVGPVTLHRGDTVPEGFDIVSYALSVTLV